jgi:hypothetical protein
MSINHLLSFIFQIIERIISEAVTKAAHPLQRIRLMSLADRVRDNYRYALDLLKMVSKNLDFAQLGKKCGQVCSDSVFVGLRDRRRELPAKHLGI